MTKFQPAFLPLTMGSLPHTEPEKACGLMAHYTPDLPCWPQLPRRSFRENMYVQFSQGFPGLVLEDDRIYVDRGGDLESALEQLYLAYLENDLDAWAVSPDYAAGLAQFTKLRWDTARTVKGQVTGPISWGLSVTDQNRRPVLYDDILADALAKHLRLKAAWQERELKKLHRETIIFVDEPYMSAYGSAFFALDRNLVVTLLSETLAGINGLKGVHCCGNTDWSILLSTPVDILSFDAYKYAESLSLYPEAVRAFLDRGGIIAWGIVPAEDQAAILRETAETLVEKLEVAMGLLVKKGLPLDDLLAAALITPSCGLRGLSEEAAQRALQLTEGVSTLMRQRYLGPSSST